MRGFDLAQMPSIVLQMDTDLREEFVECTYLLSSDADMVSPAVDQIMRTIKGLCVMDDREIDIEVALREALLNAVIHGNKRDPDKHVSLTLRCRADGGVSITIQDEGAGFDSRSLPDPTTPEHRMSTHGRGIYLMRALMDEVSFEEGGTVVHMRKGPRSPRYQLQ